jgi:hypothetical protein
VTISDLPFLLYLGAVVLVVFAIGWCFVFCWTIPELGIAWVRKQLVPDVEPREQRKPTRNSKKKLA